MIQNSTPGMIMVEYSEERKMVYKVEVTGQIEVNSYFYIDEKTKAGFVIDPGSQAQRLEAIIKEKGWTIEKILLTHGHFDHIGAVKELQKRLGCPVLAFPTPEEYLSNPYTNLSIYFEGPVIEIEDVTALHDGQIIALEHNPSFALRVISTPGHTTDSVVYYSEKDGLAFAGDTLFKGSIGRWDLPGGDLNTLKKSLAQKVLTLPDNTVIYSGHSEETTIKAEKRHLLRNGDANEISVL